VRGSGFKGVGLPTDAGRSQRDVLNGFRGDRRSSARAREGTVLRERWEARIRGPTRNLVSGGTPACTSARGLEDEPGFGARGESV
jgi:hypothetical protein